MEGHPPSPRGRRWSEAWADAADGFWPDAWPAAHFDTAALRYPSILAEALAALIGELRVRPSLIVDAGSGDGALAAALNHELRGSVPVIGLDQRPRPSHLPHEVEWLVGRVPADLPVQPGALVILHELLDEVPVDVAERHDGQWHHVLIDRDGHESRGEPVAADEAAWLDAWAPGSVRAAIGRSRDDVVRRIVSDEMALLAIDYPAPADQTGMVRAYRTGRERAAVPDGRSNLTADVFVPSLLNAIGAAGGAARLWSQREAIAALVTPESSPASADGVLRSAQRRAAMDPAGFGRFFWLLAEPAS